MALDKTYQNVVHLTVIHDFEDLVQVFSLHLLIFELNHESSLGFGDLGQELIARLSLVEIRNLFHEFYIARIRYAIQIKWLKSSK